MGSSDADPDHTKLSPFLVCTERNCGVILIGRFFNSVAFSDCSILVSEYSERRIFLLNV